MEAKVLFQENTVGLFFFFSFLAFFLIYPLHSAMEVYGLEYLGGSGSPSGRQDILCKTVGSLEVIEKMSK